MASIPSSPSASIESPATPRELAALLSEIVSRRGAVAPEGGGTKRSFGNPLSREALTISTRKLGRVLAYEPDDMTISVEAGATIGSVWDELSARGQTIPIDVPAPETETIGGLIATGLCGPRRYGSGSLRDVLIGIQAAYPDGSLGNAGGMVVKNVSGFDLMRMHLGAVGTLGIIVSANFKVIPAARGEATITVERESLEKLEGDRIAIHSGRIRPIAFEARCVDERWIISIRIEGRPSTVEQMARELADRLGDASIQTNDESRDFWNSYTLQEALPADTTQVVLQVRGKPSDTIATTRASIESFEGAGAILRDVRVSPGLGTDRLILDVPENALDSTAAAIEKLRANGLNVLLLSAPRAIHSRVDAFGTPEATLQLMRQLKRQFDPWSALNPGRVVPEL